MSSNMKNHTRYFCTIVSSNMKNHTRNVGTILQLFFVVLWFFVYILVCTVFKLYPYTYTDASQGATFLFPVWDTYLETFTYFRVECTSSISVNSLGAVAHEMHQFDASVIVVPPVTDVNQFSGSMSTTVVHPQTGAKAENGNNIGLFEIDFNPASYPVYNRIYHGGLNYEYNVLDDPLKSGCFRYLNGRGISEATYRIWYAEWRTNVLTQDADFFVKSASTGRAVADAWVAVCQVNGIDVLSPTFDVTKLNATELSFFKEVSKNWSLDLWLCIFKDPQLKELLSAEDIAKYEALLKVLKQLKGI